MIDKYLQFKRLNTQPGFALTQQLILDEAGLTDEVDLLCAFEDIVSKWQKYRIEKDKQKEKFNQKGLKTYGSRK